MANIDKYKAIVNEIFGEQSATFDSSVEDINNVTGAINHNSYEAFTNAFTLRLRRLASACPQGHPARPAILQAVNQIADNKNWDGAYAELAAFDFFYSNEHTGPDKVDCDITLPASDALASTLGNTNVNLDGRFNEFGVYFDIKVLSDKSQQIIDGVIEEVLREKAISMSILANFDRDISFREFEMNRGEIKIELSNLLDPVVRPDTINSQVIDSLCYKLAWTPGAYSSPSCYSPDLHGENHHSLVFQHTKKFLIQSPTVLIFVNFPWYGEKVPPFKGVQDHFYRVFSESFFYSYKDKNVTASTINRKIRSNISAFDVTKKLSGIIFMDDNCIQSNQPESTNVELSYFLNPFADNLLIKSDFSEYLNEVGRDLSNNS